MIKRKTVIMTAMFLIGSWTYAFAQNERNVLSAEASYTDNMIRDDAIARQVNEQILFRIGESSIDPSYMGNAQRLNLFVKTLKAVMANPDYVVSRIKVVGTSSPDGTLERNMELAGGRAKNLASYLMKYTPIKADKIDIVNGGENWAGLRMMIEASNMPYKAKMLEIMDRYPDDRGSRKYSMQYSYASKPWLWMQENFFPSLRMGAGNTQGRASLDMMSSNNWDRMREIIRTLDINPLAREQLLAVIDNEPDPLRRLQLIEVYCPDRESFLKLQAAMVAELLCEASTLSTDNWTLLREQIAASDIPSRAAILHIIDNTAIANGREQQLKALNGGEPYRQILERFIPELLASSRMTAGVNVNEKAQLRDVNWGHLREMVQVSNMPDRSAVLALIDEEANSAIRGYKLYAMNGGKTYHYISEVFFPELLYGISPTAQENWVLMNRIVGRSDLPNKSAILEIIRTTSPGLAREEAIRALDGGESWRRMSEILLPELLSVTNPVMVGGSGMSFSYELSPAAKERATALAQKQTMSPGVLDAESTTQNNSVQSPHSGQSVDSMTSRQRAKAFSPRVALKTDLMLWGGVMPGFTMGAWTPNLSVEVYFARRWSMQVGYAYSNWNALTGTKELYAVSVADMEMRHWFGKPSRFKGFYLGLYGQYGEYDVQSAPTAQTGSFWCAGIGVGWLQPLCRNLAVEFQVRGGYRSASNDHYDIELDASNIKHYYYNRSTTENKFVPSLRLNFIYRIGKLSK